MTSWDAVIAAVGLALGGQREQGRSDLLACWASTTGSEPAQRCVLAHYLADLQEDLDEEVAWDERALDAYADVGPGDLAVVGVPDAAGMAAMPAPQPRRRVPAPGPARGRPCPARRRPGRAARPGR